MIEIDVSYQIDFPLQLLMVENLAMFVREWLWTSCDFSSNWSSVFKKKNWDLHLLDIHYPVGFVVSMDLD